MEFEETRFGVLCIVKWFKNKARRTVNGRYSQKTRDDLSYSVLPAQWVLGPCCGKAESLSCGSWIQPIGHADQNGVWSRLQPLMQINSQ